ncbi:MXAN_6640 family putative metalloprotease [Nocardioides sp. CPCC 205120]|uniref:MXAN_6640 family putative metalloprotease n=1 Tax=Nocardioides sp. CPCC 205120 TaxID=3406462 RepID=UPI003B506A45
MIKRARPLAAAAVLSTLGAALALVPTPAQAAPAAPAAAVTTVDPTDPVPLPADPADITPELASRTLDRAQAALEGDLVDPATGDVESPTLALRDLFRAKPRLAGAELLEAERVLARPTDGAVDPGQDGYPAGAPVTTGCQVNVCVHYVKAGTTGVRPQVTATDAWAAQTLRTLQDVWNYETRTQSYRGPAADGTRGGDAKFDVYLTDLASQGVYGYCMPESYADSSGMRATSYCVLDNDYAEFPDTPVNSLRVTAAHEFFHAIQFNYDVNEDGWLYEATATWMEEQYAPEVDDNQQYLADGQLGDPTVPMDLFGDGSYGNWLFFEYLTQRFGPRIVRTTWEAAAGATGTDYHSLVALKFALYYSRDTAGARGEYGQEYAGFASANQLPGFFYRDGRDYGAAPNSGYVTMPPGRTFGATLPVRQQTTRSVRLDVSPAATGQRTRLRFQFTTPPGATTPGAYVAIYDAAGRVQRIPLRLTTGSTTVVLPFTTGQVRRVYVSFANASSRLACGEGEAERACYGVPLDDGVAIRWTARAERY